MKARTMKFAIKFGVAAFIVCGGFRAQGEDRTVSNAQGLVEALEALNSGTDTGNTIYLEPGNYDVSAYDMIQWDRTAQGSSSVSHIALGHVKLVGKSADPRATVIFGNGTKRVIHSQISRIECLTVSNGCINTGSTGGAGVYSADASLDSQKSFHSNVVVTCCSSSVAGGGVCYGTWYDSVIVNNHSDGNGGGAHMVELHDCEVSQNTSGDKGGGVSGTGSKSNVSHVYGGVISNNTSVSHGGGAYNCVMHGGTEVCWNKAGLSGGGIFAGEGLETTNCTIFCNEAATQAGGLNAYKSFATGCVISNNFVNANANSTASGGGVNGGRLTDCRIVFNRLSNASDGSSAATYGAGVFDGILSNCYIAGNAVVECVASKRYGGGCYGSTLTNCVVVNNFVYGGSGTGVNSGSAYGCVISNNASSSRGEDVRLTTLLEKCEIFGSLISPRRMVNCRVSGYTNGVVFAEGENVYTNGHLAGADFLCQGETYATNCLFSGNCANSALFRPTNVAGEDFANCTIAGNISQRTVYDANFTKQYPVTFVNCLFADNTYNGNPRNMWYDDAHTNITIRNCLIGAGRPAAKPFFEENTITNDNPRFVLDGSRDAYALKLSSPAIGKGLVQDWMTDALDIRDNEACPRLRDGAVDIGCYQCWLRPFGLAILIK